MQNKILKKYKIIFFKPHKKKSTNIFSQQQKIIQYKKLKNYATSLLNSNS